ncbi:DUF29 domain-containing protein [Candidatus Methylomicrobium oryzae]|jgi:hypothetical protein|uniref:DUF29 domain-containing protein n=1 Tax=Candidatus Methylomicrobium oryzae TaxID=2802053 RepID=UPI00192204C7|nr:DUF29 domain-containing protein [Methylomicrobium sp. RS1]MBL1263969.1 DUF29 domain-containing protein [Methylomicrobium sp. RS1]
MGSSDKRALEQRLTLLLVHLLKWKYQPARRGRSWQAILESQRESAAYMLKDNSTLKPQLGQMLHHAYAKACMNAAREMGIEQDVLPRKCPWEMSKILDEGFYPD